MLVGHVGPVYCCDWSRSCGLAASAGKGRSVRLWDMRDIDSGVVSCLASLEGHAERVFDVAFSTVQEHVLASASRDQTVRLWDLDRQAEVLHLGQHADEVYTCSFSQDGGSVAAGGAGRLFNLVDIRSGAITFKSARSSRSYPRRSQTCGRGGRHTAPAAAPLWTCGHSARLPASTATMAYPPPWPSAVRTWCAGTRSAACTSSRSIGQTSCRGRHRSTRAVPPPSEWPRIER